MNLNDLLAQQQAAMNQAMQNVHRWELGYLVLAIAAVVIHFTIVYLFYAHLRDIADELRKFRIAYEFLHDRKPPSQSSENPFRSQRDDPRYMPKS